MTKTYLDKLNERTITNLNLTIAEQAKQIAEQKEEIQRLSKIIHRDNKLIPAMEMAVQNFLTDEHHTNDTYTTKGSDLLKQLTQLSTERKNILHQQDLHCQQIISTGVTGIDTLLQYMQQEAIKNNIIFQVNTTCDLHFFVEQVVEEIDLTTLLGDLILNAIIATKHNKGTYILLSISIVSNAYTISIFDSGIPFTTEVLSNWGLKQTTTHASDGGNGIGMMTTYEIIKKYRATFIIHELNHNKQSFTKEITVSFNKANQYILKTQREENELSLLSHRLDLQIVRKI